MYPRLLSLFSPTEFLRTWEKVRVKGLLIVNCIDAVSRGCVMGLLFCQLGVYAIIKTSGSSVLKMSFPGASLESDFTARISAGAVKWMLSGRFFKCLFIQNNMM